MARIIIKTADGDVVNEFDCKQEYVDRKLYWPTLFADIQTTTLLAWAKENRKLDEKGTT